MTRKPLGASYWKQLAAPEPVRIGEEARMRLACPDDDAPLDFLTQRGEYVCPACSRVYRDQGGFLAAMPSNDPYALAEPELAALAAVAAENTAVAEPQALFGPLWERALAEAGGLSGKWVLDVCCGTGWAAAEFAARGAHVFAVDAVSTEGGLATAIQLRAQRGVAMDLVQADACRLPFVSEAFDVVFVARTLHGLSRPERLLKEIGRVLRPDGVLLVLGEPVGRVGAGGFGETDPRRGGRALNLGHYGGLFHEGGLRLTALFADDPPTSASPGFAERARRHLRHHSSEEARLFLGRHEGFSQPSAGRSWLPWRRKNGTES